jgi:HK97 family phage portal protein
MQQFNLLNTIYSAFGGQEYYKTPKLGGLNIMSNGQPTFLNPDSWDAFNIFMTTPQLYAVVSLRGRLLASGVWVHERMDSKGNVTRVEGSDLVNVLENPNPLLNGNDLICQWNENMCVYGNNFEYVLKPFASSKPAGFSNIPATDVTIKTTGKTYKQSKLSEIIEYYEVTNGVTIDRLTTDEINHTKVVNSQNPIKGESPLKPIYMPISNIRSAYQFRNVIMNQKGALGILSSSSKGADGGGIPLLPKERQKIEEAYRRAYGISDEQSKIIITDASMKWQPTTFPTKDLLLFEEVDENFQTIIDNFGLNNNLFSSKNNTYENLKEGLKQAYQNTIIPISEELSMNRTRLMGLDGKKEWVRLDYSHIPVLQENLKEKAEILKIKSEAYEKLSNLGFPNIDQVITFD